MQQFANLIPTDFAQKARELVLDIVKEIPDAWPILGLNERARIEQRVDAAVESLSEFMAARLDKQFAQYMAKARPHFVSVDDSLSIKNGHVKVVLKLPQAEAPPELYTHSGRLHVVLIEGQVDWINSPPPASE